LPATFEAQLLAANGAYTLTGPAVSGTDSIACNTGAFGFAGIDTYLSHEFLGGGGRILPGGQFSRRRWRELQDEFTAERRRADKERDDRDRQQREAARAAALAGKTARQAARDLEAELAQARAQAQAIEDARLALLGAQDVAQALRHSAEGARRAQAATLQRDHDEDEALALLLAA